MLRKIQFVQCLLTSNYLATTSVRCVCACARNLLHQLHTKRMDCVTMITLSVLVCFWYRRMLIQLVDDWLLFCNLCNLYHRYLFAHTWAHNTIYLVVITFKYYILWRNTKIVVEKLKMFFKPVTFVCFSEYECIEFCSQDWWYL